MLTTDPNDARLTRYTGPEEPAPQAEVYLVLSDEERAKGFVRSLRDSYVHVGTDAKPGCMASTRMGNAIAETYARDPKFYGATFCCKCSAHFPVGQFAWQDPYPPFTSLRERDTFYREIAERVGS